MLFTLPVLAEDKAVFHRANEFEPATLDPHLATDTASHTILRDTFEGLTSVNGAGEVIPGVAESWDISEDGTTYTFHLRDDARWSDGNPVTATDFVYAWQRAIDPATASSYSFILYPIKNAQEINEGKMDKSELGIQATDDHTLMVNLEAPTPYFLELLYQPATYPVVRKNIEQYGEKWTQPDHIISNGPFTLSDIVMQTTISAKKSNQYWDKDNVALDEVVYHTVENANSGMLRYRSGELDMVNVPQEQIEWARENLPDDLHIYTRLGTYYFGFNQEKPPFKDNPELRQALSMAIDRNIISEKISRGGQEPAYSIVPPQTARHEPFMPEWAKLPRDEQIAQAKKLYQAAGYGPDNPLKLNLTYNTSEDQKQNAIAIASMWKSVLGVETSLQNMEWKVLLSQVKNKNSEVFRMGWSADYNDPFTFLEIFRSTSGNNYTGFANMQYDALLDAAAHEPDLKKRTQILHEAEKQFSDDHAIMPIFYYNQAILLKPNIEGFTPNAVNVIPSRFIRFSNH
ncbi:peptide ABC transporter substrate-binding protein [Cardiobacteriaceae bacterium TAE3-ERU3]|nr:peptide ABC transporter substrate-binding protein [Cardiobacteriaceae bacterium TAE3-ERU3]